MSNAPPVVMWFRRDLRLADNPALVDAVRGGSGVVALYVLDPRLVRPAGANRLAYLAGCLASLSDDLDGRLVIRGGDPARVVPALAREVGAEVVSCAEDFGPYGSRRDDSVADALSTEGRELRRVGSPYAVSPGSVHTKAGEPFKVFTPFSRAWRAHGWEVPVAAPTDVDWVRGLASDPLPDTPEVTAVLPTPGEAAAHDRLDQFLDRRVHDYADLRDRPGADATSRLSADLRWGTLHPRQLLARLGRGRGEDVFASELCWRDFYADVLHHRPDTARAAFNPAMREMQVDTDADARLLFQAWCEGRTGYPIVDAGMRQLVAEGWMHNRVRMIVASFLVKDLHLDWTWGARFFMEHLVDGDLASNQHGWQWTAGTGTDAAPYFRIFNPVAQSKRFDPDGDYIRRWVPELRDVEGAAVHEPRSPVGAPDLFGGTGAGDGAYPPRIVDHAEERAEALRRYQALRAGRSG